jgi:hypothetical protein
VGEIVVKCKVADLLAAFFMLSESITCILSDSISKTRQPPAPAKFSLIRLIKLIASLENQHLRIILVTKCGQKQYNKSVHNPGGEICCLI